MESFAFYGKRFGKTAILYFFIDKTIRQFEERHKKAAAEKVLVCQSGRRHLPHTVKGCR